MLAYNNWKGGNMKQLDVFESNTNILVTMPTDLKEQLDDLAKKLTGGNRSKLIRFFCEEGLIKIREQGADQE